MPFEIFSCLKSEQRKPGLRCKMKNSSLAIQRCHYRVVELSEAYAHALESSHDAKQTQSRSWVEIPFALTEVGTFLRSHYARQKR